MSASFIIISAAKKLDYLLDDIRECCPANPSSMLNVSTARIVERDGSLVYQYDYGNSTSEECELSHVLADHFALFRAKCHIPDGMRFSVFLLENPLCKEDVQQSKIWLDAIKDIYSKGVMTSFDLCRVVFSYDIENPCRVCNSGNAEILHSIIENQKEISNNANSYPNSTLFYIDNQTVSGTVTSLGLKDHNFMLSRFLMDFMMIWSSSESEIRDATSRQGMGIFSAGYAECMYYYLDLLRFFKLDDGKELLWQCLNADDECNNEPDEIAMALNLYPLGLRKRYKRLSEVYQSVPFNCDINYYPGSADKEIDDLIKSNRELIEKGLKFRNEAFLMSEQIKEIDKEIEDLNLNPENEELAGKLEKIEKRREQLIKEHKVDFIDRDEIYFSSLSPTANIHEQECKYQKLIEYILGDLKKDLINYEDETASIYGNVENNPDGAEDDRPGCMAWFLSLLKKKTPVPPDSPSPMPTPGPPSSPNEMVHRIAELLKLKKKFLEFDRQYKEIESEFSEKIFEYDTFELSSHLHSTKSPYLLLVKDKLKEWHGAGLSQKIAAIIPEWRNLLNHNFSSLKEMVATKAENESMKYRYLDWNRIPSFVLDISRPDIFSKIVNSLCEWSSPFLNFQITPAEAPNIISKIVYTDYPTEKMDDVVLQSKNNLNEGNYISYKYAEYAESKICVFQVLSWTEDIIKNLVDLNLQDKVDAGELVENVGQCVSNVIESESFWGDVKFGHHISDNPKCIICGATINGHYLYDWIGNCVCGKHDNEKLERCISCGQFCGEDAVDVGSGKKICGHCKRYRIEPEDVATIKNHINSIYKSTIIGEITGWRFEFISFEELYKRTNNEKTRGLAQSVGDDYTIFVYRELSRVMFAETLAHEMLHVYQYKQKITSNEQNVEGFCNLGSYVILKSINTPESRNAIMGLKESEDPIYGAGFRKMLAAYESGGWQAALDELKQC